MQIYQKQTNRHHIFSIAFFFYHSQPNFTSKTFSDQKTEICRPFGLTDPLKNATSPFTNTSANSNFCASPPSPTSSLSPPSKENPHFRQTNKPDISVRTNSILLSSANKFY